MLNCFSPPASAWPQGRGNGSWEWGSQEKPGYGWDVGRASWDTGVQGVCNLTSAWGKHSQGKPVCVVGCLHYEATLMCAYGGMFALWSCIDVCVRWDVCIMKLHWCVCTVGCLHYEATLMCVYSGMFALWSYIDVLWTVLSFPCPCAVPQICECWQDSETTTDHQTHADCGYIVVHTYTLSLYFNMHCNNEVQNDTDPLHHVMLYLFMYGYIDFLYTQNCTTSKAT